MKELISTLKTMFVAAVVTILLMNFVFINAYVPTGSMEPTIMKESHVFGVRFLHNYTRGDIVVFHDPNGGNYCLIKRIIGLPGDELSIKKGEVFINGAKLEEDYLVEAMEEAPDYTIEIPKGGYFMMGDNRNNSFDARYWEHPIVYEEDIIGKGLFVFWPMSELKKL